MTTIPTTTTQRPINVTPPPATNPASGAVQKTIAETAPVGAGGALVGLAPDSMTMPRDRTAKTAEPVLLTRQSPVVAQDVANAEQAVMASVVEQTTEDPVAQRLVASSLALPLATAGELKEWLGIERDVADGKLPQSTELRDRIIVRAKVMDRILGDHALIQTDTKLVQLQTTIAAQPLLGKLVVSAEQAVREYLAVTFAPAKPGKPASDVVIPAPGFDKLEAMADGIDWANADVSSLMFIVMMQASQEAATDLKAVMASIRENNGKRAALREHITKLKDEQAQMQQALREEYDMRTRLPTDDPRRIDPSTLSFDAYAQDQAIVMMEPLAPPSSVAPSTLAVWQISPNYRHYGPTSAAAQTPSSTRLTSVGAGAANTPDPIAADTSALVGMGLAQREASLVAQLFNAIPADIRAAKHFDDIQTFVGFFHTPGNSDWSLTRSVYDFMNGVAGCVAFPEGVPTKGRSLIGAEGYGLEPASHSNAAITVAGLFGSPAAIPFPFASACLEWAKWIGDGTVGSQKNGSHGLVQPWSTTEGIVRLQSLVDSLKPAPTPSGPTRGNVNSHVLGSPLDRALGAKVEGLEVVPSIGQPRPNIVEARPRGVAPEITQLGDGASPRAVEQMEIDLGNGVSATTEPVPPPKHYPGLDEMSTARMTAYIEGWQNQKDSLGDLAEEQQVKLQMFMERYTKAHSTLSNLLKKLSDTAQTITQNLK